MKLTEILSGINFNSKNFRDLDIKGVSINSNTVQRDFIFVALKGTKQDGHHYIYQAIERGATVIVVEDKNLEELLFIDSIVIIRTDDTANALQKIATNFYNNPSRYLDIIGVTGTNGKTTITYILEEIFKVSGFSPGLIGTICYKIGNREIPALNTTPDALTIQKYLREMVDLGQDLSLLEASSHGLKQGRLDGLTFDYAIFTNLGYDHLDYHLNMEDYYQSKKILFSKLLKDNGVAVINLDDNYGRRLWQEVTKEKISYGFKSDCNVKVLESEISLHGMYLNIEAFKEKFEFHTPLLGSFNIYNILASLAVALKFGLDKEKIIFAIENISPIKGRLERVFGSSQIKVFVDYAHTPEALEEVLRTLKSIKKGSLWVLFGCGGNRCKEKRPQMGKIASVLADKVIITSDNPRDENPIQIIEEIMAGVEDSKKCLIIPDRKEAIEKAIAWAQPNDVILIAGKGHERHQIVGNLIIPFDDKEIASRVLIDRTRQEMANVF